MSSPPTFVALTQGTTTLVGATPAGTAKGDIVLLSLATYDQNAVTITPPAGVTLVPGGRFNHTSGGDDDILAATYIAIMTGTPPASFTFTASGGTGNGINVIAHTWRKCNLNMPIGLGTGVMTSVGGFGTAIASTALTPQLANSTFIWMWTGDDNQLTANPVGLTVRIDGTGGAGAPTALIGAHGMGSTTQAAATKSSGVFSATGAGNDDWIVQFIALNPAQADTMNYGADA